MFRLYHILMTSECKKEQLRRRRWKKKPQKQQVSAMFVFVFISWMAFYVHPALNTINSIQCELTTDKKKKKKNLKYI